MISAELTLTSRPFAESEMLLAAVPVAVDLFCGAGGLSYGMKRNDIEIAAGVDADPDCRHPFTTNVRANFHQIDISTITPEFVASLFPDCSIRILAGCAPCQPFSPYSQKSSPKDQNWRLLSKFGELASVLKPEIVTMENVPHLRNHAIFDEFMETLEGAGYINPFHSVVHCADYGVPQTRKRLVVLASRFGEITMITPTHNPDKFRTVRQAIGRLASIDAGDTSAKDALHKASGLSPTNLARIRSSRPGGSWRDWDDDLMAECHTKESGKTFRSVYGRMEWDALAPTLTTQFNGYGNGRFGHPEQDRAISLREGAILQTFPRKYSFVPEGAPVPMSLVARMIGNAVPVKLGQAIGKSIVAHIRQHTQIPPEINA